jgi:hypothetical protein
MKVRLSLRTAADRFTGRPGDANSVERDTGGRQMESREPDPSGSKAVVRAERRPRQTAKVARNLLVFAVVALGLSVPVAYAARHPKRPHHHRHHNRTTTTTTTTTATTTTGQSTTPQSKPKPTTTGTVTADGSWTCSGPVNIDSLTVTNHGSGDAVKLRGGCTGRIGRIAVTGVRNGDGIKVQGGVHDLTIEGGYVQCAGPSSNGTHQDGTQVMGGKNILYRNLVIDCYGGGGGNLFIQRAGGETPTNVICDHCALGPRHPNNINLGPSVSSGARNSLVCKTRNTPYRAPGATSPVNVNNTRAASGDARCASTKSLETWAWAG